MTWILVSDWSIMSQDLDLVCGDGVVITYPKLVAGLIFPSLATCHVLQAGQNMFHLYFISECDSEMCNFPIKVTVDRQKIHNTQCLGEIK